MPRIAVSRVLPYQPEQLFDIAADVEHYPDFLAWWKSARISRRSGDVYYTEQEVGFGPFGQRFATKTILRRPEKIEVTAVDGPFETFELTWRFDAVEAGRCRVALDGEIELRPLLLGNLFGRAMTGTAGSILSAFEDRARRLYRPPRR
jgi:coenzyme Q-binding protein COQ10